MALDLGSNPSSVTHELDSSNYSEPYSLHLETHDGYIKVIWRTK